MEPGPGRNKKAVNGVYIYMSKLGNYAEVSCCRVLLIPLVCGEFFLRVDKKINLFFFSFLQTCMKSIRRHW